MKQRQRYIAVTVNAMIEVYSDISEADLNKVGRAIDLMMTRTNRSIAQATTRAGITFLKSARARTVKATARNRKQLGSSAVPSRALSESGQKGRKSKRIPSDKYFAVFYQGFKPAFVRIPDAMTGSKKNRAAARVQKQRVLKHFKEKPNVGAAKASWNRAFSDLGKPAKLEMLVSNPKVMGSSSSKQVGSKFAPEINIINNLRYLLKASKPDLERQAMVAAGKSLFKLVDDGIEQQTKTWR